MKKILFLLFSVLIFSSCAEEKEKIVYKEYVPQYRWMDRTIYFAYSTSTGKNNTFQKEKVQSALREIEAESGLGTGKGDSGNYFTFVETEENLLQPIFTPNQSPNEYKSFILIWPDAEFNYFVLNALGGNVPDSNAITVINSAYKRKFYMIFKASCFESNSTACGGITDGGVRALVARQLGSLVNVRIARDCGSDVENVVCSTFPSDEQWNDFNKTRWIRSFDNALEAVFNTPSFYDELIL